MRSWTVQKKLNACTKYDEVKTLTDRLALILRDAAAEIGKL